MKINYPRCRPWRPRSQSGRSRRFCDSSRTKLKAGCHEFPGEYTAGRFPMTRKKYPPFGLDLRKRLNGDDSSFWGTSPNGKNHTLFLLIGADAWAVARQWRSRRLLVLFPPGDNPVAYDWSILRAADPLLLWRCGDVDGEILLALLKSVMAAGVERVLDVATGNRYVRKIVNDAA